MAKRITDADARDLDETRRLLYMALLAPRTKRYNLAGTIVNALLHHQRVDIDADELMDRVVAFVEGDTNDDAWLRDQIKRIAADLGDD